MPLCFVCSLVDHIISMKNPFFPHFQFDLAFYRRFFFCLFNGFDAVHCKSLLISMAHGTSRPKRAKIIPCVHNVCERTSINHHNRSLKWLQNAIPCRRVVVLQHCNRRCRRRCRHNEHQHKTKKPEENLRNLERSNMCVSDGRASNSCCCCCCCLPIFLDLHRSNEIAFCVPNHWPLPCCTVSECE